MYVCMCILTIRSSKHKFYIMYFLLKRSVLCEKYTIRTDQRTQVFYSNHLKILVWLCLFIFMKIANYTKSYNTIRFVFLD